jgi:hypothetical protein
MPLPAMVTNSERQVFHPSVLQTAYNQAKATRSTRGVVKRVQAVCIMWWVAMCMEQRQQGCYGN